MAIGLYLGIQSHIRTVRTQTQTNTHTYTDTSRGVSSPTALFLSGEVDLEVVRVIMDVEEAAALIELTDTSDRRIREDGSLD